MCIVKYDIIGDKLVIWKVGRKKMLPNVLYSKWDDSKAPSDNYVAAVKPVNGVKSKTDGKSAVFSPRDTKGSYESAANCKTSPP